MAANILGKYNVGVGSDIKAFPYTFEDNFEDGTIDAWDYQSLGFGSSILVNGTAAHSGSYGLWLHYSAPAGQDNNRWLDKVIDPTLEDIYIRGYVYLKTPVGDIDGVQRKLISLYNQSPEIGPTTWGIFLTSDSGSGVVSLRMSQNDSATCNISAVSDYDIYTLQYDTWYGLELNVKLNTPGVLDGEFYLYDGGVEVYHGTGWNFRGTCSNGVGVVRIGVQAQGNDATDEERYWDDIVVSESLIGV